MEFWKLYHVLFPKVKGFHLGALYGIRIFESSWENSEQVYLSFLCLKCKPFLTRCLSLISSFSIHSISNLERCLLRLDNNTSFLGDTTGTLWRYSLCFSCLMVFYWVSILLCMGVSLHGLYRLRNLLSYVFSKRVCGNCL